MDEDDIEFALTAIILMRRIKKQRFKRKPPKERIRSIFLEREEKGAYYQLVNEMRLNDREFYFR